MNQENTYHISFFKPTTPRAKYNRNMVLWLISIWAVAIFGFQILLRVMEKPTPEPQLTTFQGVWGKVSSGNANADEIKAFAQSALHVSGKVFIAAPHRKALDNGISWATMLLADSAQKVALSESLLEFEQATKDAESVTDKNYIDAKKKLGAIAMAILDIAPNDVLGKIVPLELHSTDTEVFSADNMAIVQKCMPKYTIHNRSVLTDTTFIGFPFHYFYTAVFLLILFIGLCWIYCYRVDKFNKTIEFAD